MQKDKKCCKDQQQNQFTRKKPELTREEIFEKYANDYDIKDNSPIDKKIHIDTEKYVYYKLHEIGLHNTNIEQLLNITIDECKEQYGIKQSIENRVGLLLAIWGVMISTLIQMNIPIKNMDIIIDPNGNIVWRLTTGIVLLGQMVSGVLSLWFILKTLKTYGYSTVSLRNKEINFKGAVDDKYISIMQLLDSYTNRWIDNSKALSIKSRYYRDLLKALVVFIGFVVLGYLCTY